MSNDSKERRYIWMRKAIYSSLPLGTRLMYVVLDDHCGQQGKCWYRQETLATKMGVSRRYIRQCIAELAEIGLLRVERSRTHAVYILAWSDRNQSAALESPRAEAEFLSDRNPGADLGGTHLLYDSQLLIRGKDHPQCHFCGGSGVVGSSGADIKGCSCSAGESFRRTG